MDRQLEETPMSPQHRLGEHGWLDAYAAPTVTPGGGSASAVAAALGCALLAMAARIGARKAEPDGGRAPGPAGRGGRPAPGRPGRAGADRRRRLRAHGGHRPRGQGHRGRPGARPGRPRRPGPTPPRSRWPPPSWPPTGLGLATELAGMALARTASDQLVAAHLLRAGLEGGLSTVAFNLRRMAAGPGPRRPGRPGRPPRGRPPGRRRPHRAADRHGRAAMISPIPGDRRILPSEAQREE